MTVVAKRVAAVSRAWDDYSACRTDSFLGYLCPMDVP